MPLRTIFVQVGHPCQKPPQFYVTELNVKPGEELLQAKRHRMEMANHLDYFGLNIGVKFAPADFYFAAFEDSTCQTLVKRADGNFVASDNYFTRVRMEISTEKTS